VTIILGKVRPPKLIHRYRSLLAVPWTDAIDASDQQPDLNPQGTVALRVGAATGTAGGVVVVVAVLPSVIWPLDTIGAVPPLAVSSPSAVA